MDSYFFAKELPGDKQICIAQLTDRRLAQAEEEINDTSGYFLYEQTGRGEQVSVRVLARIASEDAVFELRDMFGLV